jgi:hypothetical protein
MDVTDERLLSSAEGLRCNEGLAQLINKESIQKAPRV